MPPGLNEPFGAGGGGLHGLLNGLRRFFEGRVAFFAPLVEEISAIIGGNAVLSVQVFVPYARNAREVGGNGRENGRPLETAPRALG